MFIFNKSNNDLTQACRLIWTKDEQNERKTDTTRKKCRNNFYAHIYIYILIILYWQAKRNDRSTDRKIRNGVAIDIGKPCSVHQLWIGYKRSIAAVRKLLTKIIIKVSFLNLSTWMSTNLHFIQVKIDRVSK